MLNAIFISRKTLYFDFKEHKQDGDVICDISIHIVYCLYVLCSDLCYVFPLCDFLLSRKKGDKNMNDYRNVNIHYYEGRSNEFHHILS